MHRYGFRPSIILVYIWFLAHMFKHFLLLLKLNCVLNVHVCNLHSVVELCLVIGEVSLNFVFSREGVLKYS